MRESIPPAPSPFQRWLHRPYRPSAHRVPELNGLRVLLVFIVSWYHFWQQSWLTPRVGEVSLDFLVRAGYVPVDGTILLSGFLLFLPHARAMLLGEKVPDLRDFYQKRVMRIVPSYYFVTLVMLFAVAIPYNLYWRESDMWRDVLMHLTFTQTFNYATYIGTPIGVASWTIAIEMQAYLIFPLLARGARRNPLATFCGMAAVALAFRSWSLWQFTDYNMVVNQLPNFLDVYAIGMAAALVYVKLTTLWPEDRKEQLLLSIAATLVIFLALSGLVTLLKAQASTPQSALQAGQMVRRPAFAVLLALLTLALPFALRPIRFLMGNRVMCFLAMVSMNYYLFHQNIAVHLKRVQFPPAANYPYPNMADGGPEQPWADQYMLLCFGLSLLTAIAVTFLVEKPCAWLLKKGFARLNAAIDRIRKPSSHSKESKEEPDMSIFYRFPGGLHKALTLSYDDGVEQDIRLMEILDQHGVRCTFNLNSGCFAAEGAVYPEGHIHRRMSASQVQAVYANPHHEVAAHCLTHASLTELNAAQVAHEVLADRENLENMFGGLVRGLAYPFGTYSDGVVDALKATGTAYARTVVSTNNFAVPTDWLRLHPTCHHNAPNLMQLCDRFLNDSAPFGSLLFYLWGHSYEFEADNNWHVIEEFCEKMAGRDDVWYATNIEIVDYVNACRTIRSSADGRTLHNPTTTDVWADAFGKTVCIPAGETVRV